MSDFLNKITQFLPPSPEDFIAARVHRLLSHDPALRSILDDRIVLIPSVKPDIVDSTVASGAILFIAPYVSEEPIETTGFREVRIVNVALVLLFEETSDWEPIHDGLHPNASITEPRIGHHTLLSHAWYLINKPGNRELKEPIPGHPGGVQTVSPGLTTRTSFDMGSSPNQTGDWVRVLLMIVKFHVHVNIRTGQIENLA